MILNSASATENASSIRFELLAEVLERTALAGCLATTIPTDQLADMLIGGTVYRLVFLHSPLTEDEVTTIIGGLLTAR